MAERKRTSFHSRPALILAAAAAVLCVLYGAAVALTGSGTGFFLVWIAAGAYFTRHAFLFGKKALPGALLFLRRILCVLLIAVLIWVIAMCAVIVPGFSAKGEPDLDVIIVLGAQVFENAPSVVLRHRLDAACEYLKENERTLCVVSGGRGTNERRPEADVMKEYLVAQGIPEERIIAERESANTVENLRFSLDLLTRERGDSSTVSADEADLRVGIVTSDFHVTRALKLAKKTGFSGACGIAARSVPFYLPNNLFRECIALTKDGIFGNL